MKNYLDILNVDLIENISKNLNKIQKYYNGSPFFFFELNCEC